MSTKKIISDWTKAHLDDLAKADRDVLTCFMALWRGAADSAARVPKDDFLGALSKASGVAVDANNLRQRLLRLNTELKRVAAPFIMKSAREFVDAELKGAAPPASLEDVRSGIVDFGHDVLPTPDFTPPSGARAESMDDITSASTSKKDIQVFSSRAWLKGDEHRHQEDFLDLLEDALLHPPKAYRDLPKLRMWRDTKHMRGSRPGKKQMKEACEASRIALIGMSHTYPDSRDCQFEASHFLTDGGENRKGKGVVIIGVNIGHSKMLERYTKNTRLAQLGPNGETLIEIWSENNAANKRAFIEKVAMEIFECAKTLPPEPDPGKPGGGTKTSVDNHFRNHAPEPVSDFLKQRATLLAGSPGLRKERPDMADERHDLQDEMMRWARDKSPDARRIFALLGEFGMGKTENCRAFNAALLKACETDKTLPVPLYFDLRKVQGLAEGVEARIETMITQMMREPGKDAPDATDVIRFVQERNAIVIFDGLDEVTNKLSKEQARHVYRELLGIVPAHVWNAGRTRRLAGADTSARPKSFEGPRILISCRSHFFPDVAAQRAFLTGTERGKADANEDMETWLVLPFDEMQINAYLQTHFGEAGAKTALELIKTTYNLREMAERPVLLRFIREIVKSLEQDKMAGREINLARLYDNLVNQTFERDNEKHVLDTLEKRHVLEALALHFHVNRLNEIGNRKLDEWFRNYQRQSENFRLALQGRGAETFRLSEIFAQDLRNASLIVRPGQDAFRFGHTSVREYFLADALYRACREGRAEEVWNGPVPSRETLDFMLQRHAIEERPERAAFEAAFPRLIAPGRPQPVRKMAFYLWRRAWEAGAALPRPEVMDLSRLAIEGLFSGRSGALMPLQHALWRGADIDECSFENVDLSSADFSGVSANGAQFYSCVFNAAKFGDAGFEDTRWRYCDVPENAFAQANMKGASAFDCTIGGAQYMPPHPEEARSAVSKDGRQAPVQAPISPSFETRSLRERPQNEDIGGVHLLRRRGAPWQPQSLVDAASWRIIKTDNGTDDFVTCIAVADLNGKPVIISGGHDKTIRVFDLASAKELKKISAHQGAVTSVAAANFNGKPVIISGSNDNTIRVFDFASAKELKKISAHQGVVLSVAAANFNGKPVIISGSSDKTIRVFDLASAKELKKIDAHQDWVRSLAVADLNGKPVIISGSDDKTIRVFDFASANELKKISAHQGVVLSVAAADLNGKPVIISGSDDKTIRVFDLASGKELKKIDAHQDDVNSVAVADLNGKPVIISGSDDKTIRVFEDSHGDFVQRAAIVAASGNALLLDGDDANGYRIMRDYPQAWRDWRASYEVNGERFFTEIEDMPRG